jgi:hypothetical protein
MPDPTHRFDFGGTKVNTQVETVDKQILFFVDLHVEEDAVVSVGWNADRSKFGIYINGLLIYPAEGQGEPT